MERRLFIAIPIPADVADSLEAELESVRDALPPRSRITLRENWHFTIIFLGETDESLIPRIKAAVEEVARETAPIAVDFDRIQYAPPGRPPRMVWLTAKRETSLALRAAQEKLMKRFKGAG
ncbi:MAG: 2'-5' RNA ligase family protein, partial [Patescibacteria group bacterium]